MRIIWKYGAFIPAACLAAGAPPQDASEIRASDGVLVPGELGGLDGILQ